LLPKENRIRKTSEFNLVFKGSQRLETEHFKVYLHFANPTEEQISKLGIVTSAKVGNAVIRNKLRRQIKSILKDRILGSTKPAWIVIMVKKAIGKLEYKDVQKELEIITI